MAATSQEDSISTIKIFTTKKSDWPRPIALFYVYVGPILENAFCRFQGDVRI